MNGKVVTDETAWLIALGARIRALRRAKGFTQRELGVRVGYAAGTGTTLWNIEHAAMVMPVTTLWRLAQALEVPIATLVDLDRTPLDAEPLLEHAGVLLREAGRSLQVLERQMAEVTNALTLARQRGTEETR